ncbi:hypothetical protein [Ensifer sp. 22460]
MLAISTPTATLARETVNLMIQAIDKGPTGAPGKTFLPFDLFTPENI